MASERPLILWVEDNFDVEMREVREYLEEREKYTLAIARNVKQAKEELEGPSSGKLQTVILDIILPTGEEVARSLEDIRDAGIRLYDEWIKPQRLKVLVLTCRDDEDAVKAFQGERNVTYMTKPVWPEEVEEALDKLLSKEDCGGEACADRP